MGKTSSLTVTATLTTKKIQRKNAAYWQCTFRPKGKPCKALVTQKNGRYIKNGTQHNHPPSTGSDTVTKIISRIKKLAAQDLYKPASAIVDEVLLEELGDAPCSGLPKKEHLSRIANRHKENIRPLNPQTLAFELDENSIPEDFLMSDFVVFERRHLIFATAKQLGHLTKAKTWYIDSTFKLCGHPFTQLLTINAFVRRENRAKQVPLLFAVMSGKTQEDYRSVFKEVLTILPSDPQVKTINTGFEKAVWEILPELLPNVKLCGCSIHWTQAVWRKVIT